MKQLRVLLFILTSVAYATAYSGMVAFAKFLLSAKTSDVSIYSTDLSINQLLDLLISFINHHGNTHLTIHHCNTKEHLGQALGIRFA